MAEASTDSHLQQDAPQDTEISLESLPTAPENGTVDHSQVQISSASASIVWNHFAKKIVGNTPKGVCNYCKKELVGGGGKGTKGLLNHMRSCNMRKQSTVDQKLIARGQQNEGESTISLTNYNFDFDQKKGRTDLAKMIILHEYPLSIVDHYGFRTFCSTISPMFKVVSRNTIKKDILGIFYVEKEKLMALLNNNRGRIAITTDLWTSNHQNKGYMTITAHFIDNYWKLQSRLVRFIYVPCPHTKDVLAELLKSCFTDWNIDRKLSTITVDNCSTNDALIKDVIQHFSNDEEYDYDDALFQDIKAKFPSSCLLLGGALFHMRCCAHILNLIVQDGLSVIGDGIEKVRQSVVYWTASPKREQKFEEVARQCSVTITKKLALDCKTRWNSTYLMLLTALSYIDVFHRLAFIDNQYISFPSKEQWDLAKEICSNLEIFYETTLSFSARKFPTTNIFFPKICNIKLKLDRWAVSGNIVVERMAAKMTTKFDKYWSQIHNAMGVAMVLDPRYKMKGVKYFHSLLYGGDGDKFTDKLQEVCNDLFLEYQSRNERGASRTTSSSVSTKSGSHLSTVWDGFDKFMEEEDDNNHGKTELDNYLNEKILPRTEDDFDVLAWWKTNGPKYPILQQIARDILAIPVSTVASESAFSTSGRIVGPHRNKLHHTTLEALMCAQSWLWAEIRGPLHDPNIPTIYDDDDEAQSEESGVTNAG